MILPLFGLLTLGIIFGGLFCLVGKADKKARPIFSFWSFIIFGGSFGALFLFFFPVFLPITESVKEFLGLIGLLCGTISGSFLGWRYAVKLKNSQSVLR